MMITACLNNQLKYILKVPKVFELVYKTLGPSRMYLLLLITIQVSEGIRQWTINLLTSPMMIHKITPSLDYN